LHYIDIASFVLGYFISPHPVYVTWRWFCWDDTMLKAWTTTTSCSLE